MRRILLPSLALVAPLLGACSSPNADGAANSASQASSSSTKPPVYLDHVEAFVSQATYDALPTNAYLNGTFSDVQIRTTVRTDITYTGTYLNFHDTYLEFFPFGTFGAPNSSLGVALADEVAGGYQAILAEWNAKFPDGATTLQITKDVPEPDGGYEQEPDGAPVEDPWFQMDYPNWTNNSISLALWTEELDPLAGSTTPQPRSSFLAPTYAPTKLARNVDAVVLALIDSDREGLYESFRALGMHTDEFGTVNDGDAGKAPKAFVAFTSKDPVFQRAYFVEAATGDNLSRQGVIGYSIHLSHPAQRHTEQVGDATLQVGVGSGSSAYLWLVPPTGEEQIALDVLSQP